MLSPTETLSRALFDLQLCTPRQLAACEPEVRRITGDLPGFDSCWLDVLIARRNVTPWQAQCLQSSAPEAMLQGDYRIREPLGMRTWLAETPDRRRLVVLNRIRRSPTATDNSALERAEALVETAVEIRSNVSSSICLPREYMSTDQETGWIVSPCVSGWQLDELLVRGGRLPWDVVIEVGRSLLAGLHDLQVRDLAHGDISLRNIRLRPNGETVLVDPCSSRILHPAIGYRTNMQLRDVQFSAPELVGTGRRHDAVSDLYSLGCVLWQLLTSRPTFLSADPVRFLMQCRDRDVEDVRRWVPDCPDDLARVLQSMTRRRPELRPQSTLDVLRVWPTSTGRQRSATRRVLTRMPDRAGHELVTPVPDNHRRLVRGTWAAAGLAGCVMLGLAANLVPLPLTMNRVSVSSEERPAASITMDETTGAGPVVLPQPSADGLIELTAGRTYLAAATRHRGQLRIRVSGHGSAVVQVAPGQSWDISADQVKLSDLHIRCGPGAPSAQTLLKLDCLTATIDHCVVQQSVESSGSGLTWTSAGSGSTILQLNDSVFLSGRQAIRTRSVPGRFDCRNILFQGVECAWRCDVTSDSRPAMHLNHVTQVGGRSLIDVIPQDREGPVSMEVTCGDSVLAPADAIVRMASTDSGWRPDSTAVAFYLAGSASPTVIPPQLAPAVYLDRTLGHMVSFADTQLLVESLLMADLVFDSSAEPGRPFAAARLVDFDGPHRSPRMPGIDLQQLPDFPSSRPSARLD